MIKIYDATERLFNHNGNKIVHPLRAEITKVDNGDYYAEIQDTIANVDYYTNGAIIRIPTPWGEQGFRITNPIINGTKVECKAWHLFYDAENYIIKAATAMSRNCNDALVYFNERTDVPSPFTMSSDIMTTNTIGMVRKTLAETCAELVELYKGHLVRDNFRIAINAKSGEDRGVVLKVGKNITEMQATENWDEVCTKILPYTVSEEDKVIDLDEVYVENTDNLYDLPYTKVVNFENQFSMADFASEAEYTAAVREWLTIQAQAYLEEHALPKVNYSVSASIDNVSDVGDVIQVMHPKCKINITTEVISVQYDAIRKKYTKIEFGNFKTELKNLTQSITAEANKHTDEVVKSTASSLSYKLEEATAQINGVFGNSYVIYDGDKILVVDTLPKEKATNVIKISNGGIGFSNTGINGTFNSAWTIDGTLNMQDIDVKNLTASMIKGGTLVLGGVNNESGVFELYDKDKNLIATMNNDGLRVVAENNDYVQLNAKEGFVGYDATGNKIYWAGDETFHMRNAEVENQITLGGLVKIVPVNNGDSIGIGFVAIS